MIRPCKFRRHLILRMISCLFVTIRLLYQLKHEELELVDLH